MSWGTSRVPIAPLAPAMKTRMVVLLSRLGLIHMTRAEAEM
jgi:hypothetical protein